LPKNVGAERDGCGRSSAENYTMDTLKAHAHYRDWEGTAAADAIHDGTVHDYLETKGLIQPNEFVVATELTIVENSVCVRAFLYEGSEDFDEVRKALMAQPGAVPVRIVSLSLTLEEFVGLFKQLSVMLTRNGLSLEGREYSER
jgi:hypothetical protein